MSTKQILLTSAAGGGQPPVPTPDGTYYLNGSQFGWAFVGPNQNKPTYDSNFQFPNAWGQVWSFTGNEYMSTAETYGTPTTVYLNLWFYPTTTACILLTNQNTLQEATSYHCSVLEISGNGSVIGRFWSDSTGVTTNERVSLNAWNHVYLAHDGSQTILQLNGGSVYTKTGTWDKPNPIIFSPGGYSQTNTGWNNRYQGKIADFYVSYDMNPGSNYADTKGKYQVTPLLYVDANNVNSTTPPSVVAGPPSMGYAGPTNLFIAGDFTTGVGTDVQVGWTVSGANGWSDTVTAVTPNWMNTGGLGITVNGSYWGGHPYYFRDPAASASTAVWSDISGNGRNITLYNTPTFNATGTKYYEFDPASLQYGDAASLGNQTFWSVELWINTTASLNGTNATSAICTVFDDPDTMEHPGVINYTISNNWLTPGYTGLKAGFFDGGWRETYAFVPAVGQWLHVVGTYDGQFLKTYLNGVRDGVYAYFGYAGANGGKLRIARRWDGVLTATNMFPGKIGLVKVYGSPLNDVEVLTHYNDTKATYGL